MRPRVSVFIAVTLDGFIARPDGSIDFLDRLATPPGEDYGYADFFAEVDALVVGRATYETALGFDPWPWDGKRVVVLTHRALEARHGERAHAGDLAPLLEALAREGVRRVYLDGGAAIRRGLEEGVVDDLTLSTLPFTIGAGRALFGGAPGTVDWALESVRGFSSGLVQARYARRR